jgi:peptidoglycan/xylan/chitin deacetylase (PgdA/CDA1 family)
MFVVGLLGCVLMALYLLWNGIGGWSGLRGPVHSHLPADHISAGLRPGGAGAAGQDAASPAGDLSWASAPTIAVDVPGRPPLGPSRVVTGVSDDRRMVALTFDDNYRPELAVPVLRALARVQAPATLFLVGGPTRSHPEVTELIARDPLLEVGDHSATHVELTGLTLPALAAEIGAGVAAYREMTGAHASNLFRPPGGHFDEAVLQVAGKKGFPWTVEFTPGPADYSGLPARDLLHRIISGELTPGPLILLHFSAAHTAELVPQLVGVLRARGYKLVTVSQLIKGDDLYADVPPNDAAYPAVLALDRADVIDGYPTGDYGAWEAMSRVDLARALTRLLEIGRVGAGASSGAAEGSATATSGPPLSEPAISTAGSGAAGFGDVVAAGGGAVSPLHEVTAEEQAAIYAAVRAGLMQGGVDADGQAVFWPKASVRRIDLALALAKATQAWLPPVGGDPTPGASEVAAPPAAPADVAPEARGAVAAVVEAGLMDAPAGEFRPLEPMARIEVAKVLYRLAQVVAPQLLGQQGLPGWWKGLPAARD